MATLTAQQVAELYAEFRQDLEAKRNPQASPYWKALQRGHKRQLLDYVRGKKRPRSAVGST